MSLKVARIVWRENPTANADAYPANFFGAPTTNETNYTTFTRVIPFSQKVCDSHGIITDPSGIVSGPPIGSSGTSTVPNWVNFSTNGRFLLQQGPYQITVTIPTYASTARWGTVRLIEDATLYGSQLNSSTCYKSGELYLYNNQGVTWEGCQWTFIYNNPPSVSSRYKNLILIPSNTMKFNTTYIDTWRGFRYFVTMDFIKIANT